MSQLKFTILFVTSLLILGSCNRVPITNRKQVNLIKEATLLDMSTEQYNAFLQSANVLKTGDNAEMVKSVGEKMAKSVEEFLANNGYKNRLNQFEWEFNLVQDAQINAWCMPGGKVCFYTGILELTENEQGLAVVMGHEIAHAVARHGNERMSQGMLIGLGGMAVDVALSQKPEATRNIFLQAYGAGAQIGVTLPFSRKNELEADQLGLVFMQLAGYDASVAVDFWNRMAEVGGEKPPEFLSTHPSDARRVEEIEVFINSSDFKRYTQ